MCHLRRPAGPRPPAGLDTLPATATQRWRLTREECGSVSFRTLPLPVRVPPVELALPHVVVRICGPGVGPDTVAALSVHPVEVTEARDLWEMHRVAGGRAALLVVLTDPPDPRAVVAETWSDFPGVPVLIVSDAALPFVPGDVAPRGWIDTIRSSQPLQDICWFVLEAAGRAARVPGIAERPLGPQLIDVDPHGIVGAAPPADDAAIATVLRLRPGDSLLSRVEPLDRDVVAHALERAHAGAAQFCTVRFLEQRGLRHPVALGLRRNAAGRVAILAQPLLCGGPIIGRHMNDRDPITGLLTRWAISRALAARETDDSLAAESVVIFLALDEFSAISSYIGHRQTDAVLLSVAAALHEVFPHPALTSRLMGDSFLACVSAAGTEEPRHRAERLLRILGAIDVPGFAPRFSLRASIGVAAVTAGDHDLAFRLAECAAGEARAAGGNGVIVAGSAEFTSVQARELTATMELGSWEVWLQPVIRHGTGRPEFYEALARFDVGHRRLASRADFFTAGRAAGLLERFDRMMLQRGLEVLGAHPDAKVSVNVSHETFVSRLFPASFLDLVRRVPDGCGRIILEINSRCLAAPEEVVRPRLERLAAAGVQVAIDDFGSGICRLRYLTQYPLAIAKLDQLVTGYVDDDPLQRNFVRTVVSLCRARGITTVAEYTRSAEQLARLVEDGVELFQGELFGMPRPAAEVLAVPAVASGHP